MAKQVRAGLDQAAIEPKLAARPALSLVPRSAAQAAHDPLEELWFGKTIRRHVLEFTEVFALIGLIIAGVRIYRHGVTPGMAVLIAASLAFIVAGWKAPRTLEPVWRNWMKFAMVLGEYMTLVILSLAWTVALIPIAMTLKLIGKRVMDVSFRTAAPTYWITRDPKNDDYKLLERQF